MNSHHGVVNVALLILCVLASTALAATLNRNWRMIFNDEFEGNTLDTTKWNAIDEPGNYGNQEKQWYRPDMVTVSDGKLLLTTKNIAYKDKQYLSGKVTTQHKFFSTYGRYETRAKIPGTKGYWPAHWLLSERYCWPVGSEFDIMELRGIYPTAANGYYHYGNQCGRRTNTGNTIQHTRDLSLDYHIYAVEWFPTNITWYFNDRVIFTLYESQLNADYAPGKKFDVSPHFYILNTAIGGPYPTDPDGTTKFPNYHYIDYVRVYTWKTSCSMANVCSNHGCCVSSTVTCKCDAGWYGSSCEYWWGSYESKFPAVDEMMDNLVNGWSNDYAMYQALNSRLNGDLVLKITSSGCPGNCAGKRYSAAGWTTKREYGYGTFSFYVKSTKVSGTGLSLTAAGNATGLLEQIGLSFSGATPTQMQVATWKFGVYYLQSTVNLGFDASLQNHNYTIKYQPGSVDVYVDNSLKYTATYGLPTGDLTFGIYYTVDPGLYGDFNYPGETTVLVQQVNWLALPTRASCTGNPNPPTTTTTTTGTPPPLDICYGTFSRDFRTRDNSVDAFPSGWDNGYTLYLASNVAVNNGLTLGITDFGCPAGCGGLDVSGAGWTSVSTFPYGVYSFVAKGTRISGTGLTLGAAGEDTGDLEQIAFILSGNTPNKVNISTWHDGIQYNHGSFTVPFDTSQATHNYTFVYSPVSLVFTIDNLQYLNTITGMPSGELAFAVYYSAQPEWYGNFQFSAPSTVSVSRVQYRVWANPSVCTNITTTTGAISTTGTTIGQCSGSFVNDFQANSALLNSIPSGWGNGYTQYLDSNTVVSGGLSLRLTNTGCPTLCGGQRYSGGGWQSVSTYSYGTYTFVAKGSKISGTGLSMAAASLGQGEEQIAFILSGNTPNRVNVSRFHAGYSVPSSSFEVNFDVSQGFHNYTFVYTSSSVSYFVDGGLYFVTYDNIPAPPLAFGAYYSAQPDWYGPFSYSSPSFANISRVSHVVYPDPTVCGTTSTTGKVTTSTTGKATTTSASSTTGAVNPCAGSFVNDFASNNAQLNNIANGWTNGYTLYFYPNVAINNGLKLTISNTDCPKACAQMKFSGAGWSSKSFYSYGTYTFVAKTTNVPGTGLSLVGAGNNTAQLDQIAFVFWGSEPSKVNVSIWRAGGQSPQVTVQLPFDASQGFHNYSFSYTSAAIKFYADGTERADMTFGLPTSMLQFGAYYAAHQQWYGELDYTGLTQTHISRVSYSVFPDPSVCVPPTTTTSSTATTTSKPTTTTTTSATATTTSKPTTTTTTSKPTTTTTTAASTTTTAKATTTTATTTAKAATTTTAASTTTTAKATTAASTTTTSKATTAAAASTTTTTTSKAATTTTASISTTTAKAATSTGEVSTVGEASTIGEGSTTGNATTGNVTLTTTTGNSTTTTTGNTTVSTTTAKPTTTSTTPSPSSGGDDGTTQLISSSPPVVVVSLWAAVGAVFGVVFYLI